MEIFQKIALVFTILGAINWGLIGLFDLNLVTFLFKDMDFLIKVIYSVIGICGIINLFILFIHFKSEEN